MPFEPSDPEAPPKYALWKYVTNVSWTAHLNPTDFDCPTCGVLVSKGDAYYCGQWNGYCRASCDPLHKDVPSE